MTDPTDLKPALRKQAFAARKAAFAARVDTQAVERATQNLLDAIGPVTGEVVAGYMPIRTEIDPLPAMTDLAARNRVCVPVIQGKDRPLLFQEWTPGANMVEGPFGAAVPESGAFLRPSILIVPLVAFDARCNRLGYGGGFYDRSLAELADETQPRAIGFAFAAQELPVVPTVPTDLPLEMIVNEDRCISR